MEKEYYYLKPDDIMQVGDEWGYREEWRYIVSGLAGRTPNSQGRGFGCRRLITKTIKGNRRLI